jgi:hypothetical protein
MLTPGACPGAAGNPVISRVRTQRPGGGAERRHGVRSHPVPVALVGECSIPVV